MQDCDKARDVPDEIGELELVGEAEGEACHAG